MNKYRVDRANNLSVPCGMTSVRYIGDNYRNANNVYNALCSGIDAWDKPNETYGVVLSIWNGTDYVVQLSKGIK